MITGEANGLVRQLRWVVATQDAAGETDGELLGLFVDRRDCAAFEALVRRHGPMVMGVCRRVIGHRQDAEDAFQAAFLVLARKAASVTPRDLVGNWLYGVAHQTAVRARAINLRRQQREQQVPAMPEPEAPSQTGWDDLRPILDEELSRLPDRYRAVVVLCDVEGRTRKDAARHLGCPEGSVSSRLARARAMLAKRLGQRGVVLSAGSLATLVTEHAAANLSATIVGSTVQAAGLLAAGGIAASGASPAVVTLVGAVMNAMTVKKSIVTASLVLVAALTLGGFGVTVSHLQADPVLGPPVDSAPVVERITTPPKTTEDDAKAIQGTWRVVEIHDNEQRSDQDLELLKKGVLKIFIGSKLLTLSNDRLCFNYRLDPSKAPKEMEWLGDDDKVVARCIYELKGDDLKLSVGRSNPAGPTAAPKGFDISQTLAKDGPILLVMKRESAHTLPPDRSGLPGLGASSFRGSLGSFPRPSGLPPAPGPYGQLTTTQPKKENGLEGTWRVVETGNRHNSDRVKETTINRLHFTQNQLRFQDYQHLSIYDIILLSNNTINITSENGNVIKTLGAFGLKSPGARPVGASEPSLVIYELVGDHLKLWRDEQRLGQPAALPPGLDVTKAPHNEYQALVVLMREPPPLGPLDLEFHKNIPESELSLTLLPVHLASRMKEGLFLPLTIANHDKVEIQTTLTHEWPGGLWPLTALYASAMPENATKPGPFVPLYLAGVDPTAQRNIRVAPGKTRDLEVRIDWPGTGSVKGMPLVREPGWYRMRFLMVFEVSGKPQYVVTLPTPVHVLPTDIPNAINLLAGTPRQLERVAEPSRTLWDMTSRWDTEFRQQPETKFRELEQKAAELRKQFPSLNDQAHIMFQVAHIAAQSGINKHIERVRNYGIYVLTNSRDPLERATIYSYLGSAEEVDESGKIFPEQRRRAAEILLTGYSELLAQNLPPQAPPLPEINARGDRIERDPFAAAQAQQLRLQQLKAQDEARYVGELVKRRETLTRQLRGLYRPTLNVHGRNADGPDELRTLAAKKLPNQAAVERLLTRVTGPDKTREEGKWVIQSVKDDLAQLAVGTREGLKVGDLLEVMSLLEEKPVRIGLLRIVAVDERESVGKLIDKNGLADPKSAYVVPFKP